MAVTSGYKENGWLEFKYRATGEPIRFPVGTVHGAQDGPTLVVIGGMHGSEFAGIEAAIRLYNEVDPARLKGTLKVAMIYNVPAFVNNLGFVVPHDGKNPTRTFPGTPIGTYGEAMAYYFDQEVLSRADYVVELHGGDIPEALTPIIHAPSTGDPAVDEKIQAMACAYNVPLICTSPINNPADPPHSAYEVMAARGKPSILSESGQQGILKMEEAETHLAGLRNILVHLGMLPGTVVDTVARKYLEDYTAVRSTLDGMWYPAVSLNDVIKKGQVIGTICDYFGQHVADVVAPNDGLVVMVRTSPNARVGNVLEEHGRITGPVGDAA
jgi:uncharacterized protein